MCCVLYIESFVCIIADLHLLRAEAKSIGKDLKLLMNRLVQQRAPSNAQHVYVGYISYILAITIIKEKGVELIYECGNQTLSVSIYRLLDA